MDNKKLMERHEMSYCQNEVLHEVSELIHLMFNYINIKLNKQSEPSFFDLLR